MGTKFSDNKNILYVGDNYSNYKEVNFSKILLGSTIMPNLKFYSKYEDYNKKNENFDRILKDINQDLKNLRNLNQLNKIYTFFIKLKEDFVKENLIDCLYILKQIAEILDFNHLKTWVTFELNGYKYKSSYIPQYRRFLAVYFLGDIQYSLREDLIILDPIGEILRKIENNEDHSTELSDDERLVFSHLYDKNADRLVVLCSNLTQIAHGIKPILFDFIWILNSKMPIRFRKEIPMEKNYIKMVLNNKSYNYYGNLIYLINLMAQNSESYSIIPFLLRKLFENLIYDIFQKALSKEHKHFYFHDRKPRSFSKLIKLFNFFRNEELMEYHKGAIDDDLMWVLKSIRSKGNLAAHQLLHEISEELLEKWKNKVNNLLRNLFFILERISEQELFISDEKRLNQINTILNS